MKKETQIMFRTDYNFRSETKKAADILGLKMSAYITMVMKAENRKIVNSFSAPKKDEI